MPWNRSMAAGLFSTVLCVAAPATAPLMGVAIASEQEGPPGILRPTVFQPFNASAPVCSRPPGLTKVLAFVQENEREFLQGVNHGLAMAAANRGLEYRRTLANNDAVK